MLKHQALVRELITAAKLHIVKETYERNTKQLEEQHNTFKDDFKQQVKGINRGLVSMIKSKREKHELDEVHDPSTPSK